MTRSGPAPASGGGTSRRSALGAAAAFCLAAAAGGCGTSEDPPGRAGLRDDPAVSPPGARARRPLVQTTDIPVGGGRLVGWVLVVQPAAGSFAAFSAVCPHRGARVSPPDNGAMTCYEHMSTFRLSDGGVLGGPALRGLTPVRIAIDGTTIYQV